MPTNRLTPEQGAQVLALAAAAIAHDGVDPLNEEARFALRDDSAEHYLHLVGELLVGYLGWHPLHHTGQLVVHPDFRRRGIASGLVDRLAGFVRDPSSSSGSVQQSSGSVEQSPGSVGLSSGNVGLWAFGYLPAAQGFASALHLRPIRELLIMARDLHDFVPAPAPEGLNLRGFRPTDATDVLEVNAAAFAHHPEQGSLDAAGLAARMAEPWFDPDGLILGHDADGLAGFHWTKRVNADTGEVYVMAVAPDRQGRGYGRALLHAGLTHLRSIGIGRVLLYVDAADQVAVRMYESAGFRVTHTDLLLAPTTQEQP